MLKAFLAVFAGAAGCGLLGPAHALLLMAGVAVLARALLVPRGVRPPRGPGVLFALAAIGVLRASMAIPSPVPGEGMPPPPEAVRAEVRLTRIAQRHRLATVAEGELLDLSDPTGTALPPSDGVVRVRFSGFLDLPEGRVVVLRARWIPPRRPSDAIAPAWPGPPPRPTLALVAPSDIVVIQGPGLPGATWVDRARLVLADRLRLRLSGPAGDFALAVLLGEGSGIDAGTRADLAVLGTAHVLSVSGLHVAAAALLVGLLVVRILGPLLVRLTPAVNLVAWHMGASILAAWAVSLLAGSPPPAVRSAGMFAVAAAGILSGRPQRIESTVAATGLASLIAWPSDAWSISFLLSYGAILGLAYLAQPLAGLLVPARWAHRHGTPGTWPVRVVRFLLIATASSLAATLATTPLTLLAFEQAGPAGPLANLFAIPATTLIVMPAALGLLLVAALAPGLLDVVAPWVGWILDAFLWTQRVQARALPALVAPHPAALAAVFALSLAAIAWLLRPQSRTMMLAALGGVAVAMAFPPKTSPPPPDALVLTFLDVGKGDAVLVRCPTGRNFLVDAGEARAADGPSGLVARLRAAGVDALDGLVLTHADEDHVGGTLSVVESLAVAEVVPSCPSVAAPPLVGILAEVRNLGIPVRCVVAGVEPLPGCADPSPALGPRPLAPAAGNAASLVFRLAWRGRSVLLTADLESDGEEVLLDSGIDLGADVLKLGHHGSPGASSAAFLRAVQPSTAVVSGFRTRRQRDLSPRTALRVGTVGADLIATAEAGDVTVLLGGEGTIEVRGARTPGPRFRAVAPQGPAVR